MNDTEERETTVEVRAHTHLVLAYPAWVQQKMRPTYFERVREVVEGERVIDMPTITELTGVSTMTVAKALIRLKYLRVNEPVPLERSRWEYTPDLSPHVWYAGPTGRTRNRPSSAVPRGLARIPARPGPEAIQLPEGPDTSWTLDAAALREGATVRELFEYAEMLGLEAEIRLRLKPLPEEEGGV